jgi:UTP--glucose-1-phosphate uridylyltransferase
VILADDLLDNKDGTPVLKQMVDVYNYHRCSVLGTMNVPREETRSYGIVSTESDKGQVQRMTGIVEKPKPEEAPTTQAVVGRYILTPRIFDHIRALKPGAGGETSSPTRSPRCSRKRRCWPISSTVCATTAARSSAT